MSHPRVPTAPGSVHALYPQPHEAPRTTCLLGKGRTWRGRAPGCTPRGGWAGALASTWSEAGGRSVHGPASHSARPAAPAHPHRSLGTAPRRGSPTCREEKPELHRRPQPGVRGGAGCCPAHRPPPHSPSRARGSLADLPPAPRLALRVTQLLLDSCPQGGVHAHEAQLHLACRKEEGPRAQEEAQPGPQEPALGRARAEGSLCHLPAVTLDKRPSLSEPQGFHMLMANLQGYV